MSDLRKQIRDHYDAQSLPDAKAQAILREGGALGEGDAAEPVEPKNVVVISHHVRRLRWALALAAAVAMFASVANRWSRRVPPVSFALLAPRVIQFFGTPPELPKRSQNPEELREWLLAQGAPADFHLPAKLQGLNSYGCEVVDVRGRPAYLTCFWQEKPTDENPGQLVHLLVTHRRDFNEAPRGSTPQFRELFGWSFASWTEGNTIYTVAVAAPMDTLKQFVSNARGNPMQLVFVAPKARQSLI